MAVYLNASSAEFAKNCEKMTAFQLGQRTELPYFKAFAQQYLSLDELYQLLDKHIQQCCLQAGWNSENLANVPIFLGSTGYVLTDCEARLANYQPLPTQYSIAVIGDYLKERYKTQVFSFATSCTSAAQGIHYAYKMIYKGLCDKALVIGFETFNRLTFEHFHAMHLLSSERHYLPIIESKGMVLGEGVACLALSNQPHLDFVYELLAMQSLTDNQHLTNTSEPLFRQLINKILDKAGFSSEQIQAVKLHAVGGNSDEMENRVIRELLPNSEWIIPKTYLGHTLGATGATETAFLLNHLKQGRLPYLQNESKNLYDYLSLLLS